MVSEPNAGKFVGNRYGYSILVRLAIKEKWHTNQASRFKAYEIEDYDFLKMR